MEDINTVVSGKKIEYNFYEIKRTLLHNFLYYGDSDSIQILLNIYKIEEQIENIFPSYISIKSLKKDMVHFLKDKLGKELIASNLSSIIHDDINRLELVIYLFGYRKGLRSFQYANELEILTLKYLGVEDIYNKSNLYHYDNENIEIVAFKEELLKDLKKSKNLKKNLISFLHLYNKKVLRNKVFSINDHVDRQMSIDIESETTNFIEVENHLSFRELRGLNKKLVHFLYKDGLRIYETAYWNGLNDSVMRRYDL